MQRAPRGAPWAWAAAASIAAPVLVVHADPAQGGVLSDDAARRFVARLPHGHLLSVPGASHAVFASHPAQVAAAVLEFLTKAPSAPLTAGYGRATNDEGAAQIHG